MIWIVQKNEYGLPALDIGTAVFNQVAYRNWRDPEESTNIVYLEGDKTPRIGKLENALNQTDIIYIGTIEYTEYNIGHKIKPINIPTELLKNKLIVGDRIVGRGTYAEVKEVLGYAPNKKFLIKSDTLIKGFEPMFIKANQIHLIKDIKLRSNTITEQVLKESGNESLIQEPEIETRYFYSEKIDIVAEWRVFVFNGEIKGIKHYLGSLEFGVPTITTIEYIIKEFERINTGIKAYTVDVALTRNLDTVLLEIHNFVSCGLYGFEHSDILKMLREGYKYEEGACIT